METYTCHHCGTIHTTSQTIKTCHNCHNENSMKLTAQEKFCMFRLTRKADSILLESKNNTRRTKFEWDSSPPKEQLQEIISQIVKEWLAEGFDGT